MATASHLHLFPLILRSTQTLLSLTSLIIYAITLAGSPEDDSAYIYAIICCTLTLLTLAAYSIPSFPTRKLFLWDFCLGVLWAALGGFFGTRFLKNGSDEDGGANGTAMKVAVGIDLVVMGCWIMTCLLGCIGYVRAKVQERKQRRKGREVEVMLEGQESGVVEVEWDGEDGECEKEFLGEKSEKNEKN
jgi:hypothetical protein